MDAAISFARNIVDTRFENLPVEVVNVTKKGILDTLGVMLAASTLGEGVKEIVKLVKEGGGKPESSIIGFGGKVPAWMAAFANGAMTHALDYDDIHDEGQAHPTSHTLVAALAVAERVGHVNGEELITAVALGCDVVNRLGLAINLGIEEHGWLSPAVLGNFSATAASGKLSGLTERQMVSAFGIALNQAAGSMEIVRDTDSNLRAIRDAFCGKAGVISALLAQNGIVGVTNSLEGKSGLFDLYFKGKYNPTILTRDLGKRFEGINTSFKPWPSCRTSHTYLDATLRLLTEFDIKSEDIEEIILVVGDCARILCEPVEKKRSPTLAISAKNSLPFIIGAAVARRKVVIQDFLREGINNPDTLRLAQKVNYRYDAGLTQQGEPPAIVEIRTRDGKRFSKRVDRAYGHPQNPISAGDLIAKFRDCVSYSVKPLSEDKIDELLDQLTNLERVEDISEVIRLVSG